ncbi:MAG: hypothetical protein ACLFV7_06605 [Phycisphaerae bacterium]
MKRLAVLTNILDPGLIQLLAKLRRLDIRCELATTPGIAADKAVLQSFDGSVPCGEVCPANTDALLVVLDTQSSVQPIITAADSIDPAVPRVADISRACLNDRDPAEHACRELASRVAAVLCRHEDQLADVPLKRDAVVLVARDHLRVDPVPRATLSDMVWLLGAAAGRDTTEKPHSCYAAELAGAPMDDAQAADLAERILALDPRNTAALVRRHIRAIVTQGTAGDDANPLIADDPLFWQTMLATTNLMEPGGPMAKRVRRLARHLCSRLARPDQARKKLVQFTVFKQRDLLIDLQIRYWLERAGHEVVQLPFNNVGIMKGLMELPDAVVTGVVSTPFMLNVVGEFTKRNIPVISRREEGGLNWDRYHKVDSENRNVILCNWDYSRYVDLEIVMGPEFADIIGTHGRMRRADVANVGGLPFDVYQMPGFAENFLTRAELNARYGLDNDKKTMLWATRWSYADREIDAGMPEARPGESIAVNRVEYDRAGRAAWLEGIEHLYRRRGDEWNFLVKVHPGERVEAYQDFFRQRGLDIPILQAEYAPEVLKNVDLLVHAVSTMSLEANILDIPAVCFRDVYTDIKHSPLSFVSPRVWTQEELDAFVGTVTLGQTNADPASIHRQEREVFGSMDGRACRRAAEAIGTFLRGRVTLPFLYSGDDFASIEVPQVDDPYSTIVSPEEIEHYYAKVRACLDGSAATLADRLQLQECAR